MFKYKRTLLIFDGLKKTETVKATVDPMSFNIFVFER